MPSPQRTNLDACVIRALHAILAGNLPNQADTGPLTGDVKACIDALIEALRDGGVAAARQSFLALAKDRPWLTRLASSQPPSDETTGETEPPMRRIRFLSTEDILRRPSQQWLIPNLLPRDSIALVYGLSGGFKSFLVMAWALALGTGLPWIGHPVTRGNVAYIAAEGGYGIKKRVRAWMAFHRWDDPGAIGVKWYDQPMAMQEPHSLHELLAALHEDFAEPPVLVVIDTLSRCAAGADEDSNTEMAKVLAGADMIREQLHCTVLIVHHVGKDRERGPRGASALLCNVEAAIYVTPTTGGTKVECAKAKDARPFERLYLHAQEVSYGPDEDDASLVLIRGDESEDEAKDTMTKDEAAMYALLIGHEFTYSQWVNAATDPQRGEAQMKDAAAKFAIGTLKRAGRVQQREKRGPYSILTPTNDLDSLEDPDLL